MNALMVFVGGGLGALLRYGTAWLMPNVFKTTSPVWSTMLSNIVASVLLAVFLVYIIPKSAHQQSLTLLLITGLCGGYSTFSTFAFDNLQLMQRGQWSFFIFNILFSIGVSIVAMFYILKKSAYTL